MHAAQHYCTMAGTSVGERQERAQELWRESTCVRLGKCMWWCVRYGVHFTWRGGDGGFELNPVQIQRHNFSSFHPSYYPVNICICRLHVLLNIQGNRERQRHRQWTALETDKGRTHECRLHICFCCVFQAETMEVSLWRINKPANTHLHTEPSPTLIIA